MFHGTDLFEEQLRIPLIIAVPVVPPRSMTSRSARWTSARRWSIWSARRSPKSFRGRSLLPPWTAAAAAPPHLWRADAGHGLAAPGGHDGRRHQKVIHRISDRRWELYDLAKDPGEKHNLADDPGHQALFEKAKAAMLSFEERKR